MEVLNIITNYFSYWVVCMDLLRLFLLNLVEKLQVIFKFYVLIVKYFHVLQYQCCLSLLVLAVVYELVTCMKF